jgi:Flp pilus assembly protein TadD
MPRPSDQPLESSLLRTERVYIKLSLGILAGLCLFIALCWGGHRFYVRWQEHKFMRQAHVALEKNDLRWATMAAQRAYAVNASSLDACRTLADIAERQNSATAIEWRRQVVAIEPDSLPNLLALAGTALRFQQPAIADEALAKVSPAKQSDAGYHAAAARVALTKNDFGAAEKYFREAVRLAPNDPERQLELAEFQLRSDDHAKRDQGRELAESLKSNPKVRLAALHVLINDALRSRSNSTSAELAKELDAMPGAPYADRLLALGILRSLDDPDFAGALNRLESESAKSPEDAAKLATWMNGHNLALLAIDWSKQFPPEMFASVALRFALADSDVRLRDWRALREMLNRGSWDRAESLRLALQAKVARETGDDAGFEKNWGAAVAKAEGNPERLNMLQTIAFQWKWHDKATAVLWMLAENRATQPEALQALYRYYAAERDTAGLYRTLGRLVAVMPDDPAVKNNFAQLSLLLNAEPARARALARELHEKQPGNAAFASTYAFALYRNGDFQGAAKIMSSLPPNELNDPSVAAYYGIFLAAAGQNAEASRFLGAGEKAKLLPEEEKLLAEAKAAVARP